MCLTSRNDDDNNDDAYYDADDGEDEGVCADEEEAEVRVASSVSNVASNAFLSLLGGNENHDNVSMTVLQSITRLFWKDRLSQIMLE